MLVPFFVAKIQENNMLGGRLFYDEYKFSNGNPFLQREKQFAFFESWWNRSSEIYKKASSINENGMSL